MIESSELLLSVPANSSSPKHSGSASDQSISAQIAQRYGCALSDDLSDWFDQEIWKLAGGGEYTEAVDPVADLLSDAPESIWPGLMPCDFLPLVGNGMGDWLAVRVDAGNNASQVVQWYHGGGDWIPWGKSLAEAILFDAVGQRLPGPKRRHAIPADPVQVNDQKNNAWAAWATKHIQSGKEVIDANNDAETLMSLMLENGVSEVAVRCEAVQDLLREPLSSKMDPNVAKEFGIEWNTAIEWMFDLDRIPTGERQRLITQLGIDLKVKQDWSTVAKHARRVSEIAPDLTWGWDLLGYGLEKSGEIGEAIDAYRQGALRSIFTDQSVRLRTHWTSSLSSKFSAARLLELSPQEFADSAYLNLLSSKQAADRAGSVRQFHGQQAREQADPAEATEAYMKSGWDLGAEPMTAYGEILEQVARSAGEAGQTARARVAETHRKCLRQRFGL